MFGAWENLKALNGDNAEHIKLEFAVFGQWIGRVGSDCVRMKAVFGMMIVSIVLAVMSAVLAGIIWSRTNRIPVIKKRHYDGEYMAGIQIPTVGWDAQSLASGKEDPESDSQESLRVENGLGFHQEETLGGSRVLSRISEEGKEDEKEKEQEGLLENSRKNTP